MLGELPSYGGPDAVWSSANVPSWRPEDSPAEYIDHRSEEPR